MNTKAATLNTLKHSLQEAKILDLTFFSIQEWRKNSALCIKQVVSNLGYTDKFIVRSSSQSEDQLNVSNAGKFKSVLNVPLNNIASAVEEVILSYGNTVDDLDEILIQPMLENVTMSGVLFTQDPNIGAPYYIINYDLQGNTAAVTSGSSGKMQVIARYAKVQLDPRYLKLIHLATELEEKLKNTALDIEFAFDSQDQLYLFQVRPLVLHKAEFIESQSTILNNIKNKLHSLNVVHPYLHGSRTILGIMPDWNPAEIIGIRPKPLALSLYKELITDNIWAYQRDNYGYKNLRSFPLLIDLMGLPYIDTRVSFNSFIPKDLDAHLADMLVNYYLDCLESKAHLHDKIEFDIVFSCYTFDINDRINILKQKGFSSVEINAIIASLKKLTNNIINNKSGLWIKDAQKSAELKNQHELIFLNESFDDLSKIYWLIEVCKRYGTLPFSGLARAGFIAMQILNSMVEINVLSSDQRLAFLNSLNSISSGITRDLQILDRERFLEKYGHLRPGTYDILSPRYDEAPDMYFDWNKIKNNIYCDNKEKDFKLSMGQMKKIQSLLESHGLEHDVVSLFSFMQSAIESRELSKFIFTKTLSDILSIFKNIGKKNNISLEDMSYINVQNFLKIYTSSWNHIEEIKKNIDLGKQQYKIINQIILPPLITKAMDVESFDFPDTSPNFVTRKSITAKIATDLKDIKKINGAIVFIPSADPGYDWIFTHNIGGFVTAYGGVNSHMAIRAVELGLPAVIGVGEKLYNKLKSANVINMNCCNQILEVVH